MFAYSDDDIVLVSAIEHYSYCPRQCALIHVEQVYDENVFTLRGSLAHERTDEPIARTESDVIVERALPIWSEQYGLVGRADVVEFHPGGSIFPVEYKITPKRRLRHAVLQLCAQAICLEEMFGKPVIYGAVYSSSSHQRKEIEFTAELRLQTLEIVESIRKMQRETVLPKPVDDERCPNCSLVQVCMPAGIANLSGFAGEEFLFKASCGEVLE